MPLLDGAPPSDYIFSFNKFKRAIKWVIRITIGLSLTQINVDRTSSFEQKYRAFFTKKECLGFLPNPFDLVPEPKLLLKIWEDDVEFCRQFLSGVNPVMIEVVREPIQQLTSELREHVGKTCNLQKLADDGKLFKVDYEWLIDLKTEPHQAYPEVYNKGYPQDDPRYFQRAPQVVFRKDEKSGGLEVLAVQLERKKGRENRIFTPTTSDELDWLYAKMCVTNCDSQFHEWLSHLGKTHLTMEPHIIAMHNCLKLKKHKLYTFMQPMTQDTLLLNCK